MLNRWQVYEAVIFAALGAIIPVIVLVAINRL